MRRAALVALALLAWVAPSAHAAFPGDNGKIVFSSDRDEPNPGGGCYPDCNFELYTMNPDGSGVTRLTNTPAAEHTPAWSADGSKIAFTRVQDGGSDIWVMNADGTDQVNLTPGLERGQDPAWSPDGTKIAYSEFSDGVWVMDADGSDPVLLFNMSPDGSSEPSWAPDGSKVALTNAGAFDGEVWTVNPDGTGAQLLAAAGGFADRSPNWSPDSQRIAFLSDRDEPLSGPRVYVMDRDGTNQMGVSPLVVGSGPVWSPDGSTFAFTDFAAASVDVFTMSTDGSGVTNLTSNASADIEPDWQPLPFDETDADLLTTIDDAPDPVASGGLVTYTAAAKNLIGPAGATGAGMTIDLPPSFFFVSANPSQGSCSHSGGTVSCSLGAIAVGAEATVEVVVEPGSAGSFSVSASVSAEQADPIPANNNQSESTTVFLGGYARPKGADIIRASLVPAYRQCSPGEAGAVHGPPLEHPSCGSPAQTSGHLTIGTPDANGRAAGFVGVVKLTALFEPPPLNASNGDQNDVAIEVSATDIRRSGDLADYTGELLLDPEIRITDREHSPSFNAPGTMVDTALRFVIPCVATASTAIGGTCALQTSVEAVTPGLVNERERTIWQLGRVRVFDGGADGDVDTGVNSLFATQGVFIP